MLSGKRKREEDAKASSMAAANPVFDDAWSMDVRISLPSSANVCDHRCGETVQMRLDLPPVFCTVRPLMDGDEAALLAFARHGLTNESRRLFAPYSWDAPTEVLLDEFCRSIVNSKSRRDLHLVALSSGKICCHGFLWSMCDEIPELGIAVADA